jgi:alkylation response protein AidB-like acyl-CoA dehydrogenase
MSASVYFTQEHEIFRQSVRKFVEKHMRPYADEWEKNKGYPLELFKEFAGMGFFGIRYPEKYGGSGADYWYTVILCEELMRSGMIGCPVDMMVQAEFATGVLCDEGSEALKQEYLVPAIAGEKIAALGITEPDFGSDVAGIRTSARKDGDAYIVNGSKTFITNGNIADFITLAVRTGKEGVEGISLIIFPTDTPGFSVGRRLEKVIARSGNTAELFFENCRVPRKNLLGEEGRGFGYIMDHFQGERLVLAAFTNGMMQVLLEEGIKFARDRVVFGKPIIRHQVWRHRIADVITLIETSRQITYHAVDLLNRTGQAQREVSIAKLFSTETAKKIGYEMMQIHGGYGLMEEYPVARLSREVLGLTIGAGTSEIMREIIFRTSVPEA